MKPELLSHDEMKQRFCPVINDKCKGASCVSFEALEISQKSKQMYNKGDWIPIPISERIGFCKNPQI